MPIPVINLAQMREWERATWAVGQTEAEVIRRVGKKIAERALQLTRAGDAILILAGKGHNGDDARAAKFFLRERKIKLFNVSSPETDLPKLKTALQKKPALVIDGLFGVGLNRPLDDDWKKFIATVNAAKIPILAVDVPSGLNAETGETFGAAIEATITLTVGAPKSGMLAKAAWPFVGRLEVADEVGLVSFPMKSKLNWTLRDDFQNFPPPRPVAGHKGSFGHVAIVAGSLGFHGASVLAAHGALCAQPGLVTVFSQADIFSPVAAQLSSAMVGLWRAKMKLPETTSAILIGPGLAALKDSNELKKFAREMWREAKFPVVVDATALGWLEPASEKFAPGKIRVITPHPGEAARLLGKTSAEIQENRVASLRALSKKFGGCRVVLKGNQTLIGRADGEIFVNSSGNPHLAQGGSGDLLGGFITGLLAQPALQTDADQTIRYAVWQHGASADKLQASRANWGVEDLADEIGNAR
jgi:ADP-dependent NAD(P)H-hydrate dehydratase / NAD(P)H-hydrate epimerase